MASETVDPIDKAVPHELHVLHGAMRATSQDLLQSVRIERATFGIPAKRTACAATQGISKARPKETLLKDTFEPAIYIYKSNTN